MSSKADLVKIGMEGFAILDAYYGKKGRSNPQKTYGPQEPEQTCLYRYQPQQALVYQVKQDEIMNSYKVSQLHEGVMVKDYTSKSQAMSY
ncbi:Hypothetical predicted protein [Olea europaea subsp. europaea]|uniref:Uncharacterized protein n=1 Tax=Olea europaea subsp. europaea TaxID=158383 RepID=A0A8S0Q9N9_OLEEU|nr:Hypothetical predicted protein [Olea europaea subsp. europaea]